MAYNDKALSTITKINKALNKYGSSIKIVTVTEGAYDPYTGVTKVRTETDTKAIIKSKSSNEVLAKSVDTYELSIVFYTDLEITLNTLINFRGNDFKIVPNGLNESILQDTTYFYEVLVQR